MTYPKYPSADALRELAVRQLLLQTAFRTACEKARDNRIVVDYLKNPLPVELDPAVRAFAPEFSDIIFDWEKLTGTWWSERGWRELPQYAMEG